MVNSENNNINVVLGLPPPIQVCIVVNDLKRAVSYYQNTFGMGPFVLPKIVYDRITYLSERSTGYWEMAFARWGCLELELVTSVKPPNIYEDFLKTNGEGLHHLGFVVDNFDECLLKAKGLGIKVLMSGGNRDVKFAHLDTKKIGGTIFEIINRKIKRI